MCVLRSLPSQTTDCATVCPQAALDEAAGKTASDHEALDLRVVKGFGSKDYDVVRVSAITWDAAPPVEGFFDHSAQFQEKWGQWSGFGSRTYV